MPDQIEIFDSKADADQRAEDNRKVSNVVSSQVSEVIFEGKTAWMVTTRYVLHT